MATPAPDKIGFYYASKHLGTGGAVTERTIGTVTNAMQFIVNNLTEPTGAWDGALGYFTETTTTALRGVTFHVRRWDRSTNMLTLSAPLPVIPVTGDKFVLYVGGGQASNKEVLCMKAGGKQPEVEPVRGTNVTGVTIKKISPILGEGTLTLNYLTSTKELQIRMGTSGDYGPPVAFTRDTQNAVLFARDLVGYIIVDVVFSQLSTANRTDTFTLTAPKGNMIPNYEGYETADGVGRTRYHLFVAKNNSTDSEDAISGMMLWTGRPAGTETTLSSSYSVPTTAPSSMVVANASNWPTRGFWVKNKTIASPKVDLRYVDYRSGNTLYVKPVVWGRIGFRDGNAQLKPNTPITDSYSTANSAVIDQVVVTSGSLEDGTAVGTLTLKKYVGNMYSGYEIRVDGIRCAMSNTAFTRGYRDCSAVQWNSGNLVEPASDIDIGLEFPDENGLFSNPDTENIAPGGVQFECVDDQFRSQFAGPVFAGAALGIWLRGTILDGTQARANIEGDLSFEYY